VRRDDTSGGWQLTQSLRQMANQKKKRSVKSNPWSSFLLDRCEMVNTVPHGKSITGDDIPTSLAIKGQFYRARSLSGHAQIWATKHWVKYCQVKRVFQIQNKLS